MTVNYENFTFKVPTEKGEFCFKVKPSVETRNNRAEWSEEQCLRLTEQCEWPRPQTEGARTVQNNQESHAQSGWGPRWAQSFYIEPTILNTTHGRSCPILLTTILSLKKK